MKEKMEINYIVKFFNQGGYVLNFSTAEFNAFTKESIGVEVCTKYELSKGKSLEAYINEKSVKFDLKIKLLEDLFKYYELNLLSYEKESINKYEKEHYNRYFKAKELFDKLLKIKINVLSEINIDSDYIKKQIAFLKENVDKNPMQTIGTSKDLIESICKTILKEKNIVINKDDDMPKLLRITLKTLGLVPENIKNEDKALENSLKQICGSLSSVVQGILQIRNLYGSGHGKDKDFVPLDPIYVKLIVNSSISVSTFLWEAFSKNSI